GDHCRFRGQDSGCGDCIASRCRAEVDDACFDDALISAVEHCAADGVCGSVPPSRIASCMSSRCAPVCFTRTGTSATHCSESFVSQGFACSCETDGPPNDFTCSPAVYPRTRCCAPKSWPGPALLCNCNAVQCTPTSDGCVCTLSENVDE